MTYCHAIKVSKKTQASGYTLLELMVVIAIMGLITSFVIPYIPTDKSDRLYQESDRFEALVAYAQTQAILQSQDYGLIVDEKGYSFLKQASGTWQTVEEEPLNTQQVEEFLTQTLYIEDTVFEDDPFSQEIVPSVLLLSSGEITPFEYRLTLSEQQYVNLKYNLLGDIERESVDESQ